MRNITKFHKYHKILDVIAMIMEYCPRTLKGWLLEQNRSKALVDNRFDAIEKFYQICTGVEYIHDRDVIHRDLKPANLLISQNGTMKVADFGTATDSPYRTHTMRQGTMLYMAPEQIGTQYDKMVDIFSLGMVRI